MKIFSHVDERENPMPGFNIDFVMLSYKLVLANIRSFLTFILLTIALIILFLKIRISEYLFSLFFVTLITFDLFLFGSKFVVGIDPYTANLPDNIGSLLKTIEKDPYYRVNYLLCTYPADDLFYTNGDEPATPKRCSELFNLNDGLPLDTFQCFSSLQNVTNVAHLYNIKYFILPKTITVNNNSLTLSFSTSNYNIYKNVNCMPRAFTAHKAITLKNKDSVFTKLISSDFDYKNEVILETEVDLPFANNSPTNDIVKIASYSPNKITIDAQMQSNGILVLSENYFPGWEVYIDGKLGKLLSVDYALRGTFLTSGKHQIKFIFRPKSFLIGLFISITSFVIVLIFLSYSIIRKF
jgi:hypothetical protein